MKNGTAKDWQTPMSGIKFLGFRSLVNDFDSLTITFGSDILDDQTLYRVTWVDYCAYKNTDEELWQPLTLESWKLTTTSPTYIVENSDWIADLKDGNGMMDLIQPNARHYVTANTSFCTEVISQSEPVIEVLQASS